VIEEGYYVIYNPDHSKRDRHDVFEVYRLEDGVYVRQNGNPVWMPELGLGIGVAIGVHEGRKPRQWLYWYDEQGNQLPEPENIIALERQRAEQAQQQLQDLLERLRSRGIDPDQL
jgi:hypothetical protein